jgi:DNA-binding LacI/PurR family transcriptional regulator
VKVGLKDVADRVGLSKAAVSLYFRDPSTSRVSDESKARIRLAAAELDYRPNVFARSLSSRKSAMIAILIPFDLPYFRSTYLNEALCGIQSVLFDRGYNFVFIPSRGDNSTAILRSQLERGRGYDGFIIFGTRACTVEDMRANVAEMHKVGVPFAVLNMPDMGLDINQVVNVTPRDASAVRYLLEQGHERILLMGGRAQAPDTEAGIREYHECLAERGMPPDPALFLNGDYEEMVARSQVLQALDRGASFTAVYCLTDTMALGVYEALAERGLKVPADVSVIGKNDSFFARFLSPPLTSVRVPMFEAGRLGSESLLRSIGGEGPRKIFLKNELILRLSTAIRR